MSATLKILVVDDDAGMCETLSAILNLQGYEVATAKDGSEAIARARRNDLDFVLMDIKMPGVSGLEAHAVMKSHKPDLQIALMTAYISDDEVREALENETRILFKPLNIEELLSILGRVENSISTP